MIYMLNEIVGIGKHWVWIIDVVFGGIITIGYQKLEKNLAIARTCDRKTFLVHLFVTSSFLVFVLYDVGVYHILVNRVPFRVSIFSAIRYVLDLVMAFFLLIIVTRGLSRKPEEQGAVLLCALSAWHLAAASWQVCASLEKNYRFPPLPSVMPHFIFIALYWAALLVLYRLRQRTSHHGLLAHANSRGFVTLLASLVLAISVYRSCQVIRIFFPG